MQMISKQGFITLTILLVLGCESHTASIRTGARTVQTNAEVAVVNQDEIDKVFI